MHTIDLTNAWEPPAAGGRLWLRRFGRPSGIGPGDRVWLVMEVPPPAATRLNGGVLPAASGAAGPWRVEVTSLLAARNELLLPLDVEPETGGVTRCPLPSRQGRVWLEIKAAE